MTREYGKGRTKTLGAQVAPAELRQVAEWARQHGMSLSGYVRMRVLEDPIERVAA